MKTIVWDLDDVLNELMQSWLALGWRVEHPESKVRFADLKSNPPLRELNTNRAEYLTSLDQFRLSATAAKLCPNPLLRDWFELHGHQFHHHILTARPLNCVPAAAAWAFAHFGRWIRHFHFVPSSRPGELVSNCDRSKADVLQRLGPVDFFVDDSSENVLAANEQGICAYLFPQPWNDSPQSADSILSDLVRYATSSATSPRSVAAFSSSGAHL